ncbi:MAG: CapA family protein [Lachnospiraceae bacterium]|nr:CapA family protein [Lachnospiraceae bacterium]
MKRKQLSLVIMSYIVGSVLLLTGCGDDVEALVPESGFVYVEEISIREPQPTEIPREGTDEVVIPEAIPLETPEPEKTPEPTATPAPTPEVVTITISAAGDCSLGNYHEQEYSLSFNEAYEEEGGAEYFLRNVKDIFSQDDMTIVNLEGVLTDSAKLESGRTFNIKGDPSYAKILTEGSVEAVSMGNNHRLDFGVSGTEDTEEALEAENIVYAYDDKVGIYETKGIRIGYVSVNEVSWGYGSETLIKEGMEQLKAEGVDLIIACCHWGVEKDYYPESYQHTLGKKCIDWGADLVLGHHPHVLQGIEEYNGKYIVHSLGNFSFGANRNPSDKDTMIFQQTFTFVEGVKQEETQAKVIPCSISSVSNRNNFQPTPLEGEEAVRVIERLNKFSEDMGVTIAEDGALQQG